MSKIAIMQPTFNPWLGYFDLINSVDKFIFLDTVQLNQQSWQTRNKIKVNNKEYLISIPIVKSTSKFDLLIKDTKINETFNFAKKKLLKTIYQEYKKSEYFEKNISFIEELINFNTNSLCDYNINIIEKICNKLGIKTELIKASSLESIDEKKSNLVLTLCKNINAQEYYSPFNAKEYLDKDLILFKQNSIKVIYQNYKHPVYKQVGNEFISYIGIFDLILNHGFKESLEIIQSGRNYENSKF
ncbi:MAG: WbqC family protein [Poseidonibacter sp.]|uniref:WbqC family protein n=1 Tax=Poseidonibacter sp. TaxID=2321188 RepID=UPI00359CFD9D